MHLYARRWQQEGVIDLLVISLGGGYNTPCSCSQSIVKTVVVVLKTYSYLVGPVAYIFNREEVCAVSQVKPLKEALNIGIESIRLLLLLLLLYHVNIIN